MSSSGAKRTTFVVNGERIDVDAGASTLLDVLREELDLTGAKKACDNGECGSCIVVMNGKPTKSCLLPASRAAGKDLLTIEGLTPEARDLQAGDDYSVLHPLQQAFLAKGATQCGFCIPGMILKAHTLLRSKPNPSRTEIAKSLSKNLCRCTGYTKIIEAVEYAAELMNTGKSAAAADQPNGRAVGLSVDRLDSPATINGAAKYGADLKMPGMLHGKLLRSEHHHARIVSIDTSAAEAMPGVVTVITADDVPGTPYLPNCQPQVFVFPRDRIRFKGEALAGVVADSEAIAEAALQKIRVELEPLPHAVEIHEAAAPGAEPLYDHTPRVSEPEEVACGDIQKGFAQADVIIENEYTVPVREHAAMEPESALAYEENGKVVIRTGLYHAFVQGTESIANNLALPQQDVRIICPAMGGNFGTRGDTLIAVTAAIMARKTARPVRMVFSRAESILGSCKAPSVNMRYRTGATRDGRIVAIDVEIMHGTGSWAPFLIDRTTKGIELCYYETLGALLSHVTGPYEIENVRARAWDVLTNGPRYVPLRGTNANYLPLAYESQVDLVARELGLDPIDVRVRNAIRIGSKTQFGQHLTDSVSMGQE
ncbi:MAG: molybdopterin cofactor-binding domain-containing protein, partial [Gammaproteobacteria bacterium]